MFKITRLLPNGGGWGADYADVESFEDAINAYLRVRGAYPLSRVRFVRDDEIIFEYHYREQNNG